MRLRLTAATILLAYIWPLHASDNIIVGDSIDEVIITGSRTEALTRDVPNTVTSIGRDKIAIGMDPTVLAVITQQTPGLFATSRGVLGYGVSGNSAGTLSIRGVGGNANILVLIDGQPQYAGLFGHLIPDAYSTLMTEKVEVIRGPASMLYGSNAMGGVINIITRKAQEQGVKTELNAGAGSYGTYMAEASASLNSGRFSAFAGINHSHTDGHRKNSKFSDITGFAKIGYRLCPYISLGADMDISHFSFNNPGQESAPLLDASSHVTRGLASLSLTDKFDNTSGTLRFYYDWGHHNINDGHTVDKDPLSYRYIHNDYIGGVNLFQSFSFFEGNTTTVGADWQRYGGEAWNEDIASHDRTPLIKDGEGNRGFDTHEDETAAYIDIRQHVSTLFTIDAGIRLDHHSVTGTEWVPQAGISWHIMPDEELKFLISKGFRNPTIKEMYMFTPANADLRPQRMTNWELSYSLRRRNWNAGVNAFTAYGDNLINTVFDSEEGHMTFVNTGDFRNWGAEINGNWNLNKSWSLCGNYSFLHMRKKVTGSPESKLYVSVAYHAGKFSSSLGLQRIDGLYLSETEKEQYTLLNADISYQIFSNIAIWAKGDNLLAQYYQTYSGFHMPRATFTCGIKCMIK